MHQWISKDIKFIERSVKAPWAGVYLADPIISVVMMHKTAPIPVLPKDLTVFQPILNRLLAKDPDQRYPNAQELIAALNQLETENRDLRRSAHPPAKQHQPAESFVADQQKALSTFGAFGVVDSATQPIYESGDNLSAKRHTNASEAYKSHGRRDNNAQGVSWAPHQPKSWVFGKIGLALGGGVIALVAVILY